MACSTARASCSTPDDLVKTRKDLVSASAHYSDGELQAVIKAMNDLALATADKVNTSLPKDVRFIYLIYIDKCLVKDSDGVKFWLGKVGKVDVELSTTVELGQKKKVEMSYARGATSVTVCVDRAEDADVTIDKLMAKMLKKNQFRIVKEKAICEKQYVKKGEVVCKWHRESFEDDKAENRWRARIGSVRVKRGPKGERSSDIVSEVLLKPKGGMQLRAYCSDRTNLGISEWILAPRDTLMQGFMVGPLKKVHPKFPVKFVTLPADPAEEDKNILEEDDLKHLS